MRAIPLTQGFEAIVDDEDFNKLTEMGPWQYHNGYAIKALSRTKNKPGPWAVYMHRLVNRTPDGMKTDHINRNTLDNRRSNLRTATHSQNLANRETQVNNTSGFKGVCWRKSNRKWQAYVYKNKKQIHLGFFDTPEKAYDAHKAAALKIHGEFARLA